MIHCPCFLISYEFTKGQVDKTIFQIQNEDHILLVQIYVEDIIFGSTNLSLCEKFSKLMKSKFKMSMMGELNNFLSPQVKQCKEDIFINQAKYTKDLTKKFGADGKTYAKTHMNIYLQMKIDNEGKDVD